MPQKRTRLLPGFSHIFFQGVLFLLMTMPLPLQAGDNLVPRTLHVAVASNFLFPLKQLAKDFQAETGIELITSSGSTGTLYAQISNGAPYDVFLAADAKRPRLLEEKGFAVKDHRVTYAYGKILLWGNDRQRVTGENCLNNLKKSGRLAIANADTAPYGMAAKESLQHLGLWQDIKPRVVYGNNIAHTFQFVHTGNVDFGIVARSEYLRMGQQRPGCIWPIPDSYHAPLEQQAVLLKRAENNADAARFMTFLTNNITRKKLEKLGYGTP